MEATVHIQNRVGIVRLNGHFDLTSHMAFHNACEELLSPPADLNALRIDLSGVEFIDSSALGMLLVLHREAEAHNLPIALSNCSPRIRQVLSAANFNQLFQVMSD